MNIVKNEQEILEAFRENPDMMAILETIRNLGLKDSWLTAGSVRNFIWNLLSDKSPFDCETDVDVIFFDSDISYEETLSLEKKLREDFPQYQWELKNQVYMHQHSPHTAPYTIFPYFLLSLSYLFSGTKPIFQKNKSPDWATLFFIGRLL